MALPLPPVPTLTDEGFASHEWQRWIELLRNSIQAQQKSIQGLVSSSGPLASGSNVDGGSPSTIYSSPQFLIDFGGAT